MRIGIEAQRIFRPNKHGMDIVVLEIIKHLQLIDTENEYFIYVKKDKDVCLKSTKNFTIREIEGRLFAWWEQFILPKAVKKDKCQILHCTGNTAPIFINIPILITLHDVIFLEKSYFSIITGKGTFYQRFGNVYRKFIVPLIINKCKKIITVSNSEKDKIEKLFKTNKLNVEVVYNAADERFINCNITNNDLQKQFDLPSQFILFHGNTDPKKNTGNVFKALSILKNKYSIEIDLVITDLGVSFIKKIAKKTNSLDVLNQIKSVGYISTDKMPYLYSVSSLFLYPSLREGFGLPILEAMSCETPVITSNSSSMPEVAGNAAYLIDPKNPDQIAEAMAIMLNDSLKRNEFIEKGKKNILRFSWEDSAKQTLKIYNNFFN